MDLPPRKGEKPFPGKKRKKKSRKKRTTALRQKEKGRITQRKESTSLKSPRRVSHSKKKGRKEGRKEQPWESSNIGGKKKGWGGKGGGVKATGVKKKEKG